MLLKTPGIDLDWCKSNFSMYDLVWQKNIKLHLFQEEYDEFQAYAFEAEESTDVTFMPIDRRSSPRFFVRDQNDTRDYTFVADQEVKRGWFDYTRSK